MLPLALSTGNLMRPTRRAVALSLLIVLIASASGRSTQAADWKVNHWFGPVEVRSEMPFDSRLTAAINELPTLKADLQNRLGVPMPDRPVEVNLFASRASYAEHLSYRIPGGATRAALYVTGTDRDRVYAMNTKNVAIDVRHECTHAFLHTGLQFVPLWLDEGLAEYFEVPADQRATGNPHLRRLRPAGLARFRGPRVRINLERLEGIQDLGDMGQDEYCEAWAWTHYLLHGPEPVRQVLRDYLGEIADYGHPGLLRPKLVAIVEDPERALRDHIAQIR